MGRFASRTAVLTLGLLVAGCGGPKPADLVKQSVSEWDKATKILEDITAESSLDDAWGELEPITKKMVELNRKAAELELTPEQKAELDGADVRAALKRYNDAARRVAALPGGTALVMRFVNAARKR